MTTAITPPRTTHTPTHHTTPPPTPLTTTVPRQLVHRAAHAEVLLTSYRQTTPDHHTITAQWPRNHPFYHPVNHHHDPLLLIETIRQTIPLLTHTTYNAPLDHKQIWKTLTLTIHHPHHLKTTPTPPHIEIHTTTTHITHHRNTPHTIHLTYTITKDHQPLATATTQYTNHSPTIYHRIRQPHHPTTHTPTPPPTTLNPTHLNRTNPHDIVLTTTPHPHTYLLRTDTTHPTLYDHPTDHTPGMLLLEAARQATHHQHHPTPHTITHLTTTFHHYTEHHTPTHIHTTTQPHPTQPHTHTTTHTTQNHTTTTTTTITTTTHP
ncbi:MULTISPECIES: ScbA/BarX family gamma-butyrolactone biosynthesis protein [Streptomycetaceae]|uniref:ScbA/BarX family gamma-butyrolactone biosynthesis protein n=1 Tax=Streptomycetaceae TaxID=2062 RepID=UPI000213D70C|nr:MULTISPECIES: ScbA/BarX family gamma-butyrolactone biosynthesis protein [Streptomycetaceae]MYS57188.1 transcriptional regulator [Streptomyces sp. SID5468]CCB72739.1 putative Transcriptional regulator [Streptantibioticus cattleyicolor NRRL 8057 = DSM 46488]